MTCSGLLLAAGAGTRYGQPKALAIVGGRPLVNRAIDVLADGGCAPIYVVIGAAADSVLELLPQNVVPVRAPEWARGMGASLRTGMSAVTGDAALIHLVDLPDVDARVVARLRALAAPDALYRASYGGIPGHPVVVGQQHWTQFVSTASGDQGARDYLRGRATMIDCTDLATGIDLDEPTHQTP